jgi:hypothetical protein
MGLPSWGTEPRTPEDIAAFQLPPAGYDPYMFRIEPEPLRDRRPSTSPRAPTIEALVSHQRDKDIRSAPNVPIAAAFLSSADRHSRFRLRPVPSLGGGVISNDARDYLKRDAAFRTTWDFGGAYGVFVETAIDDRSYHTPPADGISRSSAGEQYRAGVSFAPLGNTVRGEVSLDWDASPPSMAC